MAGTATARYRQGERYRNMGTTDRVVSALIGAWMLTGRRKRRHGLGKLLAVVSGVLFLRRAATGHSAVYEQLGVSSTALDEGNGINIEDSVRVDRPIHEVYAFMRDLRNLPRIFTHLAEVRVDEGDLSHWRLKATPAGRTVEWDVRVLNDRPNEYISWTSVDGSQVQQSGSVHFTEESGGTNVHVKLRYRPPGGAWGFGVARWFNPITAIGVHDDLMRLKQLLEGGAEPAVESGGPGPGQAELFETGPRGDAIVTPSVGVAMQTGAGAVEPMRPLNEPEPVVVRGWELEPDASREIEGAPVPRAELERAMAGLEGADAARPVESVDEDFRGGTDL